MRPQYLDSARQNASTYLLSLSSNSTKCWSTHGDTYELVSRTRVRSSLRPKNPETPKSLASVLKNMVTYPPFTHTFLKQPFLTDFKKYTHTPPPYATKFWCIGQRIEKSLKNCEFAPCWHLTDVPERYALDLLRVIFPVPYPPPPNTTTLLMSFIGQQEMNVNCVLSWDRAFEMLSVCKHTHTPLHLHFCTGFAGN